MSEQSKVLNQAAQKAAEREGKYLTFSLNQEEYGISILKVKEIIRMMQVTPLPQTPDYVKGVINLRGKVIPVMDLRVRFGMGTAGYTERTCIVVVEMDSASGKMHIGLVVDSVSEVVNIKDSEIDDSPAFGTPMNTAYILGMAKMAGGVKILLDIDRVLSAAEMELIEEAA